MPSLQVPLAPLPVPTPFLKWAGGKQWLVDSFPEIFQVKMKRYVEPFLGSGAVYFWLQPTQAMLSDLNSSLISTYAAVRNHPIEVYTALSKHAKNHCRDYYYRIRDRRPRTAHHCAARFIYLNRTCWNGLFRVNRAGQFNVPMGTKCNVLPTDLHFKKTSSILQSATMLTADFEKAIDQTGSGDFLFVDPPYCPAVHSGTFLRYTPTTFSWQDQLRLHDRLRCAKARGTRMVICNAYDRTLRKLYSDIGDCFEVTRSSCIAGEPKGRGVTRELLVISH